MTGFPGRNGRRRRVLNEDVLSASTSHVALRAIRDEEVLPRTPRYSEAAGVEHHPQITDFIPRRYRSIALLGAIGPAAIAALIALNLFAEPIAQTLGLSHTTSIDLSGSGNLGDWASTVTLFVASVVCWIIYFLRRHRIDDIRGRYRAWFMASLACLVISVDSVAALHTLLADTMVHITGWGALRNSAAWWLALAGVPALWIAARAVFDAKECRLSSTLLLTSLGAYAIALVSYLGWLTPADPRIESSISAGVRLLGHWSLLLGLIAYARYVILDAQGLIPIRVPSATTGKSRPSSRPSRDASGRLTASISAAADVDDSDSSRSGRRETEWVDGSRPEADDYDREVDDHDGGGRKLTKADRKRLRKLKDQHRAA